MILGSIVNLEGKERKPIDKAYYICQTYNHLGKNACTNQKIEARDLYNLVFVDIQEIAAMALKDKEAFVRTQEVKIVYNLSGNCK